MMLEAASTVFYLNWEFYSSIVGILVTGLLGVAVWCSTKKFNENQTAISNHQLQKELFGEFNKRYDRLNNKLDTISKMEKAKWDKLKDKKRDKLYSVIIDYFNICAEEYYWKQEDRIDDKIWTSWEKGMNDIYNRSEVIQNYWEKECQKEGYKSYYIDKPDAFFKKR